ncbi:helix-turn-helix transcriptional regulator [Providencia vermicola]|uniref:helix-turn-helix domain-containing protein n=1 Tax=Providencia vermicola TaxID=333965 RepID=UPI0013A74D88|nr:helix-turn-helix transcriptional regulator [Providencia vermicola]QIC15720.1 helix-turn-helix transcriptional regulator [Providencia vermicola]
MQTQLRFLRKKQNLTLSEIARSVDIDVASLSRIERGQQKTSFSTAEKLSLFFNGEISVLEIIFPENYQKEPVELTTNKNTEL